MTAEISLATRQDLDGMIPVEPGSEVPSGSSPLPEPSFKIRVHGKTLAVVGFVQVLPGIMWMWGYVAKDASLHALALHKATLRILQNVTRDYRLRRIEATVRCGYRKGWRWAFALGFRSEGMMTAYGPDGSNHWRFARVTHLRAV